MIPWRRCPVGRGTQAPPSSHPLRYSRTKYLFASSKLVIFMLAESKRNRFPPSRSETAPRLKASEIGPASRKSPYVGRPPLTAATHSVSAAPRARASPFPLVTSQHPWLLAMETGKDLSLVSDEHHSLWSDLLVVFQFVRRRRFHRA